jgi:hypothetical protein
MRILFLCSKHHFTRKMSRGRFHYVDALGWAPNVHVRTWGNGWPGYDASKSVSNNIAAAGTTYDVVYAYKPCDHIEFAKAPAMRVIDYNEMYNIPKVTKQIEDADAHLLICHHANEMAHFAAAMPNRTFVHIPHCSNPAIFRDYHAAKTVDFLVVGRISMEHYPLRTRLAYEVVPKLVKLGYVAEVWDHPGYDVENADSPAIATRYAQAMNAAHMVAFCTGVTRTRFAKFNEAALCNTAIVSDLPVGDGEKFFKQFVIKIDSSMRSDAIVDVVERHLKDKRALRARAELGRALSSHYTLEWYAKHAISAIKSSESTAQGPPPQR